MSLTTVQVTETVKVIRQSEPDRYLTQLIHELDSQAKWYGESVRDRIDSARSAGRVSQLARVVIALLTVQVTFMSRTVLALRELHALLLHHEHRLKQDVQLR